MIIFAVISTRIDRQNEWQTSIPNRIISIALAE